MKYPRGKAPARLGAVKLAFSSYVRVSALPPLPQSFGSFRAPYSGWDPDGNLQAGCCVIAAAEHVTQAWAIGANKPVPAFGTMPSLTNYANALIAQGCAPYNPENPATDAGLDMAKAAAWWQKSGLVDASGNTHTIDAYVAVHNVDEVLYAAFLFRACGIGLLLPDSADAQFDAGEPWSDLTSPATGGHCVPILGRNSAGNYVLVTWGRLHAATPAFVEKRMDEGIAFLSQAALNAQGMLGTLNWTQLQADLALVQQVS
jgi:hypothetical protein